jgi:purine-nucleoside phosphorylase
MKYADLLSGIYRYVDPGTDLCARFLGVEAKKIAKNVVISPGWGPERVPGLGKAELIASGVLYGSLKVWAIDGDVDITYIQTGCGTALLMDALLALGVSDCKNIVFISSVGSIDSNIKIGDIVILESCVTGDGASRYIASDRLDTDVFGEKTYPDAGLLERLKFETEKVCGEVSVRWHIGRAFCIDTIFAQFSHIDTILKMGCNTLDMETAAAFRAAKMMKKPMVALSSVSDNTIARKSLVSKASESEDDYRKYVRKEIFPKIILNLFRSGGCSQ